MKIENIGDLLRELLKELPEFQNYWREIAANYEGAQPHEVNPDELCVEFARFTLELWQDSRSDVLRRICKHIIKIEANPYPPTRQALKDLKDAIVRDWDEQGVGADGFHQLMSECRNDK
jgi:hypothetical protein